MRAMRLERYNEPLVLRDLPTPRPGPGEVLVKVAACGVCRTKAELAEVVGLVQAGRLRPVVSRTFPLEDANEAPAEVAAGRVTGRCVLVT